MGFFNDLFGDPKGKKAKREVERLQIQELWQPAPFPFERPVSG